MDIAPFAPFCFAYSKDTDRPCFQPAIVQGVCQDHAVLCRVCKEDPSARGVCEGCMRGALQEKMELEQLLLPGKACAVCEQAPVYQTPSGTLCPRCGGGVDLIDVSPPPATPAEQEVQETARAPAAPPPATLPAPAPGRRRGASGAV